MLPYTMPDIFFCFTEFSTGLWKQRFSAILIAADCEVVAMLHHTVAEEQVMQLWHCT